LSSPTAATVKRLYAVAGNECAFPNCRNRLVVGETVTGEVCHIKGKRPGAARYDPDQSDEKRHSFDNLVLMCPIHHKVIDDDPDSYSVSRLTMIKQTHEAAHVGSAEPSDAVVNQLLLSVAVDGAVHGSLIASQQQSGGQVAHTITNIGTQPAPMLIFQIWPNESDDNDVLQSDIRVANAGNGAALNITVHWEPAAEVKLVPSAPPTALAAGESFHLTIQGHAFVTMFHGGRFGAGPERNDESGRTFMRLGTLRAEYCDPHGRAMSTVAHVEVMYTGLVEPEVDAEGWIRTSRQADHTALTISELHYNPRSGNEDVPAPPRPQ
jgi:hypothetical protein